MSVSKIANRYAKSLIDLGKEKGILEALINDVSAFIEMGKNREFSLFLKSPIIKNEKKLLVFDEFFKGKVNDVTMDFFNMVVKKGRENILIEIFNSVLAKYKEMKGVTTVVLTSASELTEEEFKKISAKLKGTSLASENVEFVKQIDPSIIGGFIIEIGDKYYDASIAGKMKKIKKELI